MISDRSIVKFSSELSPTNRTPSSSIGSPVVLCSSNHSASTLRQSGGGAPAHGSFMISLTMTSPAAAGGRGGPASISAASGRGPLASSGGSIPESSPGLPHSASSVLSWQKLSAMQTRSGGQLSPAAHCTAQRATLGEKQPVTPATLASPSASASPHAMRPRPTSALFLGDAAMPSREFRWAPRRRVTDARSRADRVSLSRRGLGGAKQQQILDVAGRPVDRRLLDRADAKSVLAREMDDLVDRAPAGILVANDPALADLRAPDLELWLDQANDRFAGGRPHQPRHGRQHQLERDERDIDH